ncbi:MAG: hypothetical protein WCR30_04570 [Clostridia bacterium]
MEKSFFEPLIQRESSPITIAKCVHVVDPESVDTIVLQVRSTSFGNFLKPYEISLLGKKMWEWVAFSAPGKVQTTTCSPEADILSLIHPFLGSAKYTLVLFSDTPLITSKTVSEIVTYASTRDMNVLRLVRGYVFNTEWAKTASGIASTISQSFNDEEFYTINSCAQIPNVINILKMRVLDHLMNSGVVIFDPASTFIDAETMVESGVQIHANNTIRGKSLICKGTILENGNFIENSIIKENCHICHSLISNEKIEANSNIVCKGKTEE